MHARKIQRALTMGRLYLLLFGLFALVSATPAAVLPQGFTEKIITSGLSEPTAMAVAPDGRVFVCEQGGRLRVIRNGALLTAPFVTLDVDPTGERGLLGVAFDPNFPVNGFVYVYYTAPTSPRHNRVARLTANGDVASAGSETILLELDELGVAAVHNGGAMHFGADGMLYIAVGDNARPTEAQSLGTLFGKILRIKPDGSIPADNPFLNHTSGNRGAIWAMGLRNPFTFDVEPGTSHLLINDVGENSWEEINRGFAGANYGWPIAEGPTSDPNFAPPLLAYPHSGPPFSGCAITGGAFYPASISAFPASFSGKYFFADFCSGWIRTLDPADGSSTEFAYGISLPVDLKTGADGSLYYLARGENRLYQIIYTGVGAPAITEPPASQTIAIGKPVTFTVTASGAQPLAYQWQQNGVDISAANSSSFTISAVKSSDDGAQFRCVVSNALGTAVSAIAILHVTTNQSPAPAIQTPADHTLYAGGDTISYSGTAMDPEDGELPPAAFTWWVDFHHETHFHPFLPPQSGARNGSFVIPTVGEKSPHVWYRIHLKVVDSAGSEAETFRDVLPRIANVTLTTQPEGLQLSLDGEPAIGPFAFTGVAGIVRTLATPQSQNLGGTTYRFDHWSDGGAAQHDFSTPLNDTTLTAVFVPDQTATSIVQFSSGTYQVSEGDGHIDISVMRTGNTSSSLDVSYETNDGTAAGRSDYLPAIGRLNFAAGETVKIIRVLITSGSIPESNETFTLTLTGVSGPAALGSPSLTTVTIVDDDTVPPTSNPSDDTEFFVRQQYQDFLNREADASGLEFWMHQISVCGTDSQCRDIKRQDVSAAFFLSIEFQQTGDLVYRLNVAAFQRFPRFRDFLRDSQTLGRNVIVGQGDWEEQLQKNQTAFLGEFVNRAEFVAAYPETLSATEFVDKLNLNTGLSLSPAERDQLVQALNSGQMGRPAVLAQIANNTAFVIREFNRAFVLLQYFGYLRRDPDDVPDTDLTGYNFWLEKLNQFNGNYDRAQMVIAFIRSTEYRQRFGP